MYRRIRVAGSRDRSPVRRNLITGSTHDYFDFEVNRAGHRRRYYFRRGPRRLCHIIRRVACWRKPERAACTRATRGAGRRRPPACTRMWTPARDAHPPQRCGHCAKAQAELATAVGALQASRAPATALSGGTRDDARRVVQASARLPRPSPQTRAAVGARATL